MEGNKIANGSYYVVQQFRNYLINPLSSLSGASNVETLGSNLLDDTISDVSIKLRKYVSEFYFQG